MGCMGMRAMVSSLFLSALIGAASSVRVGGVSFPASYSFGETTLHVHNTVVGRYMYIFRLTANALYLADENDAARFLDDVPKALEIYYFVPVRATFFQELTREWIEKNVSPEQFEELEESLEAFNALYSDIARGDRYLLRYIPGEGTTLSLNGVEQGRVEGAAFGAAVFSIWFGSSPIDERFKARLLGL